MESAIKVSIIIPAYNIESFIANCIECCIGQSFDDIEIVLVNDGSTDESGNIIERYRQADHRIKHIKKQNEGLSFARKTGVEHAVGEYIFHLDGDDTITSNAIENLYKEAILNDADIVVGEVLVVKGNSATPETLYSNFGSGTGPAFLEYILKNQLHYVWGKLIKRSLYTRHTINVVKEVKVIGEDQMLMYQLCMFANKVSTISNTVYHYRINDDSITKRKMENAQFTIHQEHYANMLFCLLHRFGYNNTIRQQLNSRILLGLYVGLHRTGHYVVNKTQSVDIMRSTLANAIFTAPTLLFKYPGLLARCFISLLYPAFAFKVKKNAQPNVAACF